MQIPGSAYTPVSSAARRTSGGKRITPPSSRLPVNSQPLANPRRSLSDGLRRHYRTCSSRIELKQDIPVSVPGGRPRRACQGCVALRKACDRGTPCFECVRRSRTCLYQRSGTETERNTSTPDGESTESASEVVRSAPPRGQYEIAHQLGHLSYPYYPLLLPPDPPRLQRRLRRFEFLLNFTRTTTGINSSYNFKRPALIRQAPQAPSTQVECHTLDPGLLILSSIDAAGTWESRLAYDLQAMAICDLVDSAAPTDHEDRHGIHSACHGLFTGTKIRENLELFWDRWHPHCPIIHRPTFELSTASPTLVMAMVLLGEFSSPGTSSRDQARALLDITEQFIFTLDVFGQPDSAEPGAGCDRETLAALQAAYFICVMQKWEGKETARSRVRRQRFTTLIAVR